MDSNNVFTAASVFEPTVPFTRMPEQTAESTAVHTAQRVTCAPQSLAATVTSTLFSCVLVLGTLSAAASDNIVRPEAIVERPRETIDWQSMVNKRLAELLALPDGWEPGAPAISQKAAEVVMDVLERAATIAIPTPAVVPTVEGGVQFEWHENGVDLELRATPNGEVFAYYVIGDEEREISVLKPRQVRRLLRALAADRRHA